MLLNRLLASLSSRIPRRQWLTPGASGDWHRCWCWLGQGRCSSGGLAEGGLQVVGFDLGQPPRVHRWVRHGERAHLGGRAGWGFDERLALLEVLNLLDNPLPLLGQGVE